MGTTSPHPVCRHQRGGICGIAQLRALPGSTSARLRKTGAKAVADPPEGGSDSRGPIAWQLHYEMPRLVSLGISYTLSRAPEQAFPVRSCHPFISHVRTRSQSSRARHNAKIRSPVPIEIAESATLKVGQW